MPHDTEEHKKQTIIKIQPTLEQIAREFCADVKAGKPTMHYVAKFESALNNEYKEDQEAYND